MVFGHIWKRVCYFSRLFSFYLRFEGGEKVDLRFYIGLILVVEVLIFGLTCLMGYDLKAKQQVKVIIAANLIVLLLSFGVYLMIG